MYMENFYGENFYYIVELSYKVLVIVLCYVIEIDLRCVGEILLIKGVLGIDDDVEI